MNDREVVNGNNKCDRREHNKVSGTNVKNEQTKCVNGSKSERSERISV
jgi:hypothetical protein